VKEDVLLRARVPRRVRPGQRIRVRLVLRRRRRGTNRTLSFRMRVPHSLRPGRRAMVLSGTAPSSAASLEEELSSLLTDLLGDEGGGDSGERPEAHTLGELARLVSSFHHGQGIVARFRRRGRRRLIYENGSVAFTGSARVPLRVVRRRSPRRPARRTSSAAPRS
jgi:hypothetical protein